MPERDEFKPGLYNFYVYQGPRKDDASKQALGIHIVRGRKSDSINSIPASLEKGVYFAAVGQHEVNLKTELQRLYDRYKAEWVREFDVSPLKEVVAT